MDTVGWVAVVFGVLALQWGLRHKAGLAIIAGAISVVLFAVSFLT
jgi:hypothetical protein